MRAIHRSGFTLLEAVVALMLFGVAAGSIALVQRTSSQALETGAESSSLNESARQAMERISSRLPSADRTLVSPTPEAPFYSSSLDFTPCQGYADGAVQWGDPERIAFEYTAADPDDGVDNDGNGLIDDGQVVWTRDPGGPNEERKLLCRHVPELLEGELPNGEDDNGNGLEDEAGLAFDFREDTVTVRLTLQLVDRRNQRLTRTVTRAMTFRNRSE